MRVIQTVNDTIRLLFNPKTEVFSLSDFLLVRDNSENFLAQVVEIYDDKFDQEANVAKIKLIYRIINGNEIVPYDNYTPSRECEVAKIKQSEIEKCINLNKKTIYLGTSFKTKEKTSINTDFFDNNCVIFSDKYEQTNQIFENIAPRLSEYKHVLILDFSGSCVPEGAVSYTASDNFRLPLSSDTIDYIQQKILLRAKLETQVVLSDVFEEVKNYLSSTEEDYIPFSRFIKVIHSQCRQTPAVELLVLISWLKKYARHGIFAKNIREAESLFKSIDKNKITTLDLSSLKIEWQKEYVEYITKKIKKDVFVLIRLNDNNINNEIINSIYFKCKNISFIPSFAYGYKKASYIMDFARNYILMPTLNPKRDFTHATFQIQSLNKESFMIFGEDTKDFIFILENQSPVKKRANDEDDSRDKMFISLNLQLEDMTALELRPNNFEVKQTEIKKKRLQEEIRLEDVLGTQDKEETTEENQEQVGEIQTEIPQENYEEQNGYVSETPLSESEEAPQEAYQEQIQEPEITEEVPPENVLGEDELDYFDQTEMMPEAGEEDEAYMPENYAPEETFENNQEEEPILAPQDEPEPKEEILEAEIVENVKEEPKETETVEEKAEIKPEPEEIKKEEETLPKIKEAASKLAGAATEDNLAEFAESQATVYEETKKEEKPEAKEVDENEDEEEVINDSLLDAIDEANGVKQETETIEETKDAVSTIIKEVVHEKTEEKPKTEETKEEKEPETKEEEPKAVTEPIKETKEPEEDAIDKKFKEIINEEKAQNQDSEVLKINDKVTIDLDKIKKEVKKKEPKLPVFNDEDENQEPASSSSFKEGDVVFHADYGKGEILKVMKYGERCLLHIEFEEVGKRLLDPKMAKLKVPEDV